jgi:cytosine/adenosine deaminase-related metal-dependent hydrolase
VTAVLYRGCAVAAVDAAGSEWADGHVLCDGDAITSVGAGPGEAPAGARVVDARGCLATPGLVNCHHHLYQWATRGLAQESTLFEWLVALYDTWAGIDVEILAAAARAGLASLAVSGCSTTTDHHYVFPREGGDLLAAEIEAAAAIGLRFHPCRGSMDLGRSHGGLPPDEVVEDLDVILAATDDAITRYHDPSPDSMLRIAVAPCSPFSVTAELMREAATLARRRGVRLHTHLAETVEEEAFCRERFGCRPVEYVESLGWLGDDVWFAHCVHVSDDEIGRLGATGTGVAHCPGSNARLGAGIAPAMAMVRAGVPVGLGVDGAASNESGVLQLELKQALLMSRARYGPASMACREALALGTIHGARCLGRAAEIGSLEVGKRADVALWRVDDLGAAGIDDPVAALVLGPPRRCEELLVAGRVVVAGSALATGSETEIAADAVRASRRLQERAAA